MTFDKTPLEYEKESIDSSLKNIMIVTGLIVSYIFLTILIGLFVTFGGMWFAITLSYLVAIGGGIFYCIAQWESNDEFIKEYRKEYSKHKKNDK